MASSQTNRVTVAVRIDSEQQERLEHIAYRKSKPGDYETVSSIGREAIREYIEEHDTNE